MSYQYRLQGPHSDPDTAKRIIFDLPVAYSFKELLLLSSLHIIEFFKSLFSKR